MAPTRNTPDCYKGKDRITIKMSLKTQEDQIDAILTMIVMVVEPAAALDIARELLDQSRLHRLHLV